MKAVLGIILMVAGFLAGVYAGVWWAFIGGIIQVINAVQAAPVDALNLALGIARIVFAGFIGWVTAFVAVLPGYLIFTGDE